ncbi:hypothetical protein OC844_001290 [Tilletia horrida]|nr:hypothetical protein OC844_001290 [Tilletia horrida]
MSGPPIQSIAIPRSEQRSTPSPAHRVYAVIVSLPVRSWTVYRRYSDFLALHTALSQPAERGTAAGGGGGGGEVVPPPAPFPPKHAAKHALRQITSLGGLLGSGSPASTSASAGAETETLEQRERRSALETYLRAIIASTDARWRSRTEFLDFLEIPRSSVSVSVSGGGSGRGSGSGSGAGGSQGGARGGSSAFAAAVGAGAGRHTGTASSREPLSSPSASMPGALPSSPPPSSSSTNALITRTLGAPPAPANNAQPAEHLAHQQALMAAQDASLSDLTSIIRRQRAVGLAINQELAEQNELLGALDEELEQTGSKMRGAERKMETLEGKKR